MPAPMTTAFFPDKDDIGCSHNVNPNSNPSKKLSAPGYRMARETFVCCPVIRLVWRARNDPGIAPR
jgi:hypothetical protein